LDNLPYRLISLNNMNGIVYIALGHEHLQLALKSISSIYDTGSFPLAAIITDSTSETTLLIGNSEVKIINISHLCSKALSPDIISAYLKTQLYKLSPFDKTLFLDTDVRAARNIDAIWTYRNKSIAVAPAFDPIRDTDIFQSDSEEHYTQRWFDVYDNYTQYNTGVFLFEKCNEVKAVFEKWEDEYNRFQHHENMAFNRLVAQGLQVDYLLQVYNDFYPKRTTDSVLVHYIGGYKHFLND
jgi:Nucleotide-diphospho-sugar transferase